jgi:hypothetical protein
MQISWHGFHVLYTFGNWVLGFHVSKAYSNIYISTKPKQQVYNNNIWPNGCVFINNNK